MDPAPLVADEIEAGSAFLRELNRMRRVVAACWLREDEESERYLNVAVEGGAGKTVDDAYDDVRIAVDRIEDHYIDPFRVKIIGPDHRIAKAILELHRQYPKRPPSRLNVGSFGGRPVADLYVYPPINGTP
jgi:hypothetical protein